VRYIRKPALKVLSLSEPGTIYSHFEIRLKPAVVGCLTKERSFFLVAASPLCDTLIWRLFDNRGSVEPQGSTVAVKGSAKTDRNFLVRNSHTQFCAVVVIPLFHRFITESRIDTWIIA